MNLVLKIDDMSCDHCVKTIQQAVSGQNGVTRVEVSLEKKMAVIMGQFDQESVIKAIEDAGYKASKLT